MITINEFFPVSVMQFEDTELADLARTVTDKVLEEKRLNNKELSARAGPNASITLNKSDLRGNTVLRTISAALCEYCKTYLKHVGMSDAIHPEKVSLYVNNLGLYGSQETHMHCSSPVTGVLYVDIDPGSSPLVIENPNFLNHFTFEKFVLEHKLINQGLVTFSPANGRGVIFPGWLKHYVNTNYTEKRVVLTFVYYY